MYGHINAFSKDALQISSAVALFPGLSIIQERVILHYIPLSKLYSCSGMKEYLELSNHGYQ